MPARLFLSSGDLMADRRFEFRPRSAIEGRSCRRRRSADAGDRAGAEFHVRLVHARRYPRTARRASMRPSAAFQKAQASDPDDRHGAGLRLMRLGAEPVSGMPQAYVQTLFDQYAPRFESSLVDDLGYRGPALLFKAVLSVRSAARKPALVQARHRSRLRHRACGGRLRQAGRSFHRRRSVAAHDRAGARHRRSMPSWKSPTCCRVCARGRTPAPISFLLRMPWSTSPNSRRFSPRPAACWRQAGCSPSPPKPMAARASSSAMGCATPMLPLTCAPRSNGAGLELSLLEDRSARNEDHAPVPGLVVVAAKT